MGSPPTHSTQGPRVQAASLLSDGGLTEQKTRLASCNSDCSVLAARMKMLPPRPHGGR